jgi:hypothetical protein
MLECARYALTLDGTDTDAEAVYGNAAYGFTVGHASNGYNSIMVTFMSCATSLIQFLSRFSSSLANSISLETTWNCAVKETGVFLCGGGRFYS